VEVSLESLAVFSHFTVKPCCDYTTSQPQRKGVCTKSRQIVNKKTASKGGFMLPVTSKLESGLWWLRRGFWLIPVQPGTKRTCAGFGVNLDKIKTSARLREWFNGQSRNNLAVVGWGASIILDFDDINLYKLWAAACPDQARSYTETTPRGGKHVFMWAGRDLPSGLTLRAGVELKRTVLVAPSQVDKKQYQFGTGEILEVNPLVVFSSLSEPGAQSPRLLQNIQTAKDYASGKSLIREIKLKVSPVEVLASERPQIKIQGLGRRWLTCCCPFHSDDKPSMWIDTERGLWGCHGCGAHGDVINLYAKFQNVTVDSAIRDLAERLGAW
jgi:hypothetical protein